MRHSNFCGILAVAVALALVAGCGQNHGFRGTDQQLVITAESFPAMSSGEDMDFMLGLDGGCGGPFVIQLIDGTIPTGLKLDFENGRHHVKGVIREAGQFNFTLRVTDTGCDPDSTTTQSYTWSVPVGDLRIVGANPELIPNVDYNDPQKYPVIDALQTVVYGTFTSINLIAAGGFPPYSASLIDDPADPDDGPLPLGMGIAIDSTNLVGTPNSVGPNGKPFKFTFRVTDDNGSTADVKLQWKVDTPRIVIATTALADAKAGTSFSSSLDIVDGVPPLGVELLDGCPGPNADVSDGDQFDDLTYASPLAPVVNSLDPASTGSITLDPVTGLSTDAHVGRPATYPFGSSRTAYPAAGDDGIGETYPPGHPSEGLYATPTGQFVGVPRRRGNFTLFFHAYSTLVPNERGQHAFVKLAHRVDPSEPPVGITPAFGIDPSIALENAFTGLSTPDGLPTLPEAEQTVLYNPDAATQSANGLQCTAEGGVAQDGFTDAPHEGDRMPAFGEVNGYYAWDADNDHDGLGPITGLEMFETFGSFGTETQADANGLPRQGRRQVKIWVTDSQLPLSVQNYQEQVFGISVGPDKIIITKSTTSTTAWLAYWSYSERHEWNDHAQQVRKFQSFQSGPVEAALDDTDLPATHSVPAAAFTSTPTNPLGALLSGATGGNSTIDIHRPTVVATGWWDDMYGLNPKAARHGKHADYTKGYLYYGQFGSSYSNQGNWQPSVPCLDIPDGEFAGTGVTAQPGINGIFDDGGRLYVFESSSRFGIFIIRENTQVYVPFAMQKNSTIECFGDGLILTTALGRHSAFQTVQTAVSPNGRFMALKLKKDAQNFYEHAGDSKILLISLWGEKIFGGETYKIIETGSTATGAGNRIMHASSMALTNTHLYFIIGSKCATGTGSTTTPLYYQSWSGHYLMQYEVMGTATAASLMTSTDTNWTQASGTPMQSTYHHHGPSWNSSYQLWESQTFYGNWPYHRYWMEGGMNLHETGNAPTPFRCSADGRAVAFMAGSDSNTTSSTNNYSNYAWVCFEGSDPRRATTSRRHCYAGSGRGYTLTHGPDEYAMWGRVSGPTTCLEISDDGLALAFVHNMQTSSVSTSTSYSSNSHAWYGSRDNIQLCRTTNTNQWATIGSTIQRDVTTSRFTGSHRWRFGALCFTEETNQTGGAGLIFWGGAPVYQGASSYWIYNQSYQFAGTFYCTALNSTDIKSMLTTTEGGANGEGVATYTATNLMNPSSTSGSSTSSDTSSNRRYGCIQPSGGFISKNRKFMYVCSYGALSTSDPTGNKLVGLNVTTTNSGSFNSHTNCEGDVPAAWPSRRGFQGHYRYEPTYYLDIGYAPSYQHGLGYQNMAKDKGWVFFMASYQSSGPARYYYNGGPPVRTYYYGARGYGGVGLYGFNADLNGRIAALHHPANFSNTNSSSYWYKGEYMEVPRDGSRISYSQSSYDFYDTQDRERVRHIKDINFDTTDGTIHAAFNQSQDTQHLQSGNGRHGESMTIPGGNPTDVWYAFRSTSNENQKYLVKAVLQPDGSFDITNFTSLPGRINVLHGGR